MLQEGGGRLSVLVVHAAVASAVAGVVVRSVVGAEALVSAPL